MSLYPSDSLTSNTRLSARNFAATELVADITIAQTQFTVKDATQYPSLAAGEFFIAVISHANDATKKEVVKVTDVSSATWTVQRGYEGSSSFAFPAKSSIECRLTAGTLGLTQGFVLKRPSGTSHQAYPFHEYLLDGGATLNFNSAHFAEGQRVRVRTYSANANQRVNLATSAGNFFILDGRCSWAEVALIGGSFRVIGAGVDVFDAFWDAANNDELYPYRNYRAVYDGSLFVLRMPSGASNKARFTVKFEGFDGSQGKLGEVRLSGSEVFDLPFVSSVLTIDRPMVLTFQRTNSGKWSIVDGVGVDGSYNALENRVEDLESWPKTGSNANGTWVMYEDGLMKQSGSVSLNGLTSSNPIPVVYPLPFIGKPVIVYSLVSYGGKYFTGAHYLYEGGTDANERALIYANATAPDSLRGSWQAVGRWK